MMTDARQAIVKEALTWLRTPYHDNARIKGVGVDCLFPAVVYSQLVLLPAITIPFYSPQWHLHTHEELYRDAVERYCRAVEGTPQPGDFVLFHFGNVWSHGAIVIDWPTIIHAKSDVGVSLNNAARDPFHKRLLIDRKPLFYTVVEDVP
jgi:cell wall-associated NlpC family hydrolase